MKILLLEDESELNQIAMMQLERMGHEVMPAFSVKEAEVIMDEKAGFIDCVLADHKLPDGMGIAFCVHCRMKYPEIAVGVVSGCLTAEDKTFMKDYEIPWWEKPVVYSNVANKLRDMCKTPKMPSKAELEEHAKEKAVEEEKAKEAKQKKGLTSIIFKKININK